MDFRAPVFLLLSATVATAQTSLVLPGSHAGQEGTGSTNVPFGRSSAVRVQSLYDPLLFSGPCNITAIAFRLDGGATTLAKQIDCEIHLMTAAVSLVNMSQDFAQNRGSDDTVVLPRQVLALPAQSTAATPNPFLPPIAFAQPFAYDPALGPLLVEVVVFAQPPAPYTLDTTFTCDSPEVAFGPPGCPQPGGTPIRVENATTQVIWGRPWLARVLDAPPGRLTVLALGTQETGTWNGWTLPQDLGMLGAPGCFLSIDVVGTFFQTAATDGTATFAFFIPNNPATLGATLRYQAGALSPNANALGLVTSQAKKVDVCGWEPVGRVWAAGLTTTAGSREIGVAPVVQVSLQ